MSQAYERAGVSLEAGYESVRRMEQHVARTKRDEVLGTLGRFGACFDLSQHTYQEPVLVSGTDGVGTKLLVAMAMNRHDTIGVDAVAMCVNDIVVQGAEPLFFLDYLALGKTDPERVEQIVSGLADGCEQAGCSLIGGETAEMPDMYDPEEYDVAGFVVGIAEKRQLLSENHVQAGDVLIGIASSGVHSNGFSLVRKVIEDAGLDLNKTYAPFQRSLGEELLEPTKIYTRVVLSLIQNGLVRGAAHITGGGLPENVPRMLPDHLGATIDRTSWQVPDIFRLLQSEGELSDDDLFSTFNMGVGLVVAVRPEDVETTKQLIENAGETASIIGKVTEGADVRFEGDWR
ncbi:phosphoribosylformylglycinamidine cyclo-ligase [Texcoconibacillus texcoconensis]|uniref:Phosphoribosylformylglycinamidine cyclo-ligase n=1 Tax=Texcoconibacillus texcoconensis TaxID=1095777 RepID=A0A840QMF8_9BACI|nr:phosphoribosylformylglycinamidine cyclo-ligase [Texcoconibacillus texcoconensis]MBB5172559.1 phosphoribosylformylglycinamidine cyclo-ligase [Texcoconibacillus texcoconensis]